MVRIPGFHPGDPGSIPGRRMYFLKLHACVRVWCAYVRTVIEAMAQLVARRIPDPKVASSNLVSFIHFFYKCSALTHARRLTLKI